MTGAAEARDVAFARAALARKLTSKDHAEECVRIARDLAKRGKPIAIEDVSPEEILDFQVALSGQQPIPVRSEGLQRKGSAQHRQWGGHIGSGIVVSSSRSPLR